MPPPDQSSPPSTLLVTGFVLLLTLAILIVWDYYVIAHYGRDASITIQIYELAQKHPIVPLIIGLVIGLVLGHIFWEH